MMFDASRRRVLKGLAALTCSALPIRMLGEAETPPNIVLILADDLGWGDLGCYGAHDMVTPRIDGLAKGGVRFTDFYAASTCVDGRACLMSGCYSPRTGFKQAYQPTDIRTRHGLSPAILTIPRYLTGVGYRCACIGKWGLGSAIQFLPIAHGFDEFFGIPYSNTLERGIMNVMRGNQVIKQSLTDREAGEFTEVLTLEALEFIERSGEHPFFLYLSHVMPHVALQVSPRFGGISERGIYGDCVATIDWSVGRIEDRLRELGLWEQTLLIFASDNGPWLLYGTHGGSAGPWRQGKQTVFEGGFRVPCVVSWPGVVPKEWDYPGIAGLIDLLPTFASAVGKSVGMELKLDGIDLLPGLLGHQPDAERAFVYYRRGEALAIRLGRWKLRQIFKRKR